MHKRFFLSAVTAAAMVACVGSAMAQDKFKIGLILPMTGPFASTGKQIEAAARLYMAQNGDMVGGKKVELIVKDDTSAADVTINQSGVAPSFTNNGTLTIGAAGVPVGPADTRVRIIDPEGRFGAATTFPSADMRFAVECVHTDKIISAQHLGGGDGGALGHLQFLACHGA